MRIHIAREGEWRGQEGFYQFLIIIIIIKLILLKIKVITLNFKYTNSSAPLPVTRFIKIGKRATDSVAFTSYINKTRRCVSYALWK
jgi:hypothetical protein